MSKTDLPCNRSLELQILILIEQLPHPATPEVGMCGAELSRESTGRLLRVWVALFVLVWFLSCVLGLLF